MKRQTKKVNLDVPKGVESGMTMKMSRQGVEAVVGNAVGDLLTHPRLTLSIQTTQP